MTVCAPCTPTREPTKHIYYGLTKSLCAICKKSVDAKIHFRDDKVWFNKYCPAHGHQEVMVASSVAWYLDALSFVAPASPPRGETKPVKAGCPYDCGPCKSHQQRVFMPVVPITSACNLDCPICYTINKNEDAHVLSKETFQRMLDHMVERAAGEDLDIINFTGGEPTLHPELPELLRMSRRAGFRRLTISTNGLKLRDEAYVKELAEAGARIVLSLDTFDDEVDMKLLGATTLKIKLRVLELLEKNDVTTTILPAIATGLNDKDVPRLLELVLQRPNVCSLEMHTLTFTGQGGVGFERSARITVPDLHDIVAKATEGRIGPMDFVPSPVAHPHCYSISYVLVLDGEPPTLTSGYVPFTRFMSRARVFELLADSLYMQPREKVERYLTEAIDEIWANASELGAVPEGERVLATLKRLIRDMFPSDGALTLEARQKIAERATKAIYIHSHMDEESFDVSRLMKCSVGVPGEDGSNIPTCSYNVLYRERDHRFADPEMLARIAAHRELDDPSIPAQHAQAAPKKRGLPIVA
jgi:7,8-dihydro-6-hydroxymethylpterin dimethyltransferase